MNDTLREGVVPVVRAPLPRPPVESRTFVDGELTVVDVPEQGGRSRIAVVAPQWMTTAEALALARLLRAAATQPKG